jgi:hypothetical protein
MGPTNIVLELLQTVNSVQKVLENLLIDYHSIAIHIYEQVFLSIAEANNHSRAMPSQSNYIALLGKVERQLDRGTIKVHT